MHGPVAEGQEPLSTLVRREWRTVLGITALGISSVITQITLVRELLSVFDGNELVMGVSIAAWLLLTGCGSWVGRRGWGEPGRVLVIALVLTAVLPFGHLVVLRTAQAAFMVRGSSGDIAVLVLLLPLTIGPYCVCAGYLLTTASRMLSGAGAAAGVGSVYVVDSAGDVVGGVLFSFVLAFVCGAYGALYVPAALCLAAAAVLATGRRYLTGLIACAVAAAVVACAAVAGVDRVSIARAFEGQEVVRVMESLYGRLVVTRQEEQVNFYENGVPFASSTGSADQEAAVHFVLAQTPAADLHVLLVSGALEGAVAEALSWGVDTLDYVELDPAALALARQYRPELADCRVRAHTGDARRFVRQSRSAYDAIILRLPPPGTMQINRFFTVEFYREVRHVLKPGGIISCALPGADGYVNNELAELYRSLAVTAGAVFSHARLYPMDQWVLALSDSALEPDAAVLFGGESARGRYMDQAYLSGVLTPERVAFANTFLSGAGAVNRDLFPVAFRLHLRYWLTRFGLDLRWLWPAAAAVAMLLWVLAGPIAGTVGATGFCSMVTELAVLLMFQAAAGYMYYSYGVMVSLFMAGLAAGGWLATRWPVCGRETGCVDRVLAVDAALVCVAGAAAAAAGTGQWHSTVLLYALMAVTALLSGMQFPCAASVYRQEPARIAGTLYAADLLGAAMGALVFSVLLAPSLGVSGALLVVVAVKVLSAARVGVARLKGGA